MDQQGFWPEYTRHERMEGLTCKPDKCGTMCAAEPGKVHKAAIRKEANKS
jgi:hypothetical protein